MVTLKERVPKSLRTPVSLLSILIGLVGLTVGYIFTLSGLAAYYKLLGIPGGISSIDSLIIFGAGIFLLGVAYMGFKGFMYFSY
jgi:TRAP-type C4-dicarboxylate transport system permease small subunit